MGVSREEGERREGPAVAGSPGNGRQEGFGYFGMGSELVRTRWRCLPFGGTRTYASIDDDLTRHVISQPEISSCRVIALIASENVPDRELRPEPTLPEPLFG